MTEKQEWFARLIAQGVCNSEACRIVGINRRTGTRWRYGRTILNTAGQAVHYPPVRISAAPQGAILDICRWPSGRRSLICTAGGGCARHRREIGRAPRRCSGELRRNADPACRTRHMLRTDAPGRDATRVGGSLDEQLHSVVAELLGKRWSPEQVAHDCGAVS